MFLPFESFRCLVLRWLLYYFRSLIPNHVLEVLEAMGLLRPLQQGQADPAPPELALSDQFSVVPSAPSDMVLAAPFGLVTDAQPVLVPPALPGLVPAAATGLVDPAPYSLVDPAELGLLQPAWPPSNI